LSAAAPVAALLALPPRVAADVHSFEFVAEHLPEVAMDNRYASLPLWSVDVTPANASLTLQPALTRISSGGLALDGGMGAIAARRALGDRWSGLALGFVDHLRFSGASDRRPLETLFTHTPLSLPADASFTDLRGVYRNSGFGLALSHALTRSPSQTSEWVAGVLYQRVELRDYRVNYRVLDGASSGASGTSDYSGTYDFTTPFAGLSMQRRLGSWSLAPHALFAIPLPRRALRGRITGPGFDLAGDTAQARAGKHVGDVSVTFGLDATYEPWGVSLDIGSLLSQALIEPLVHKGIERNLLLSVSLRF
jgi:hypothetical protein